MSSTAVRQKIQSLVEDNSAYPFVRIENKNPKPPVDGNGRLLPFVSAMFTGFEDPASVGVDGKRCWREYGTAMVIFFYPSNTGTDPLITEADKMRSVLRGKSFGLTDGSLELQSVDPLDNYAMGRWAHSLGDYFTKAISVAYRYDFID